MSSDLLSRNLKAIRKEFCMTQDEASELCGISPRYWRCLETKKSSPSLEMLNKITKGFRISFDDLLKNEWNQSCFRNLPAFDYSYPMTISFQELCDLGKIYDNDTRSTLRWWYAPIPEVLHLNDPDEKICYVAFAIQVRDGDLVCETLHDVTCNKARAMYISALLTTHQLDPIHFLEYITDIIGCGILE